MVRRRVRIRVRCEGGIRGKVRGRVRGRVRATRIESDAGLDRIEVGEWGRVGGLEEVFGCDSNVE